MTNVLIVGSGGREDAIAWKLGGSHKVAHIYVVPGNAGTAKRSKCENISIPLNDFTALGKFCQSKRIELVIVGPEDPLANGLSDYMAQLNICCFGPSKAASQIESSKAFAKDLMAKYNIPTAQYRVFTKDSYVDCCEHIRSASYKALVIKASGLAGGKGVVVANSVEEAVEAVSDALRQRVFGAAGDVVVVEELLEGDELSVLCFVDGETVRVMPPAQDHKRLRDGDLGPNTGGMGAYCPATDIADESVIQQIKTEILEKTVAALKSEGITFKGVLFAGIMLTSSGPKVLEFNCRFGDPETQALLPLLKTDLYDICKCCVNGSLDRCPIEWEANLWSVGVVLVSSGYPGSYPTGIPIKECDQFLNNEALHVFHAGTKTDECGQIVTNGGRVVTVLAQSDSLERSLVLANEAADKIHFEGAFHRRDIGQKALKKRSYRLQRCQHNGVQKDHLTYEAAGVSVTRGNALVAEIKSICKSTARPGADVDIGGFGGCFDLKAAGFEDPILVSGTDGVGTKLKIANICNHHETIGQDLVAMCVNDILVQGAEPLYFLDYFATGKLNVTIAAKVVSSIAEGCRMAGCALIGGETAEMPGFYEGSEYDLAGFAVGAVERTNVLPKTSEIKSGDLVIGLKSSGVHSNGYSLVRKVVEKCGLDYESSCPWKKTSTLGEELLAPTRIYVSSLLPLLRSGMVKGAAHITGGGLTENLPRVFPTNLAAQLDASKWPMPEVFCWIAQLGNVTEDEMSGTFNCGIGMALIVDPTNAVRVQQMLTRSGEESFLMGHLVDRPSGGDDCRVRIANLNSSLKSDLKYKTTPITKVRVAVLISGSGTNLQALIDHTHNTSSVCEIALVISNKPGVMGLSRAQKAGIKHLVVDHTKYGKEREAFDMEMQKHLTNERVEMICLAGFMRILSDRFCQLWRGRMLNIHPSLLPSFKGANAVQQVLESGVRITGATVHFVVPELDSGAILYQEAIAVDPRDTEESLLQRVHSLEHKIFPLAMESVATKKAQLHAELNRVVWQLE